MANKRVLYAAKKAGIGPVGAAQVKKSGQTGNAISQANKGRFRQIHGLQSVGITTTFNLEQTFELGQLAIYEQIEGIPDISIECEKVLDGYCPVYVLATSINGDGTGTTADNKATSATLIGRSKAQCDFCLAIYKDTDTLAKNLLQTSGSVNKDMPDTHVMMSGVFVNSVSYNVGIDGYASESVTMVGQDKVWHNLNATDGVPAMAIWSTTDYLAADESPLAFTQGSGGAQRREDVLFSYPGNLGHELGTRDVNNAPSGLGTILPRQIPGISASGTNDRSAGQFSTHVQSFSCSTDFGREDIFELGRRGRYHRFVPFPTEVTCEITAISTSGDLINATEEGFIDPANTSNLQDETIRLHLREGLLVDLGKKNKLASVSVTGGDAGGGNEEITYSYTNFNDFTVFHPQDPLAVTGSGFNYNAAQAKTSGFTLKDGRTAYGVGIAHANV